MPETFDLIEVHYAEPVFGMQIGKIKLKVHPRSQCEGRDIPCVVHAPSEHHMRDWELNWRADKGVMERLCPHGQGHPDPDHMAYVMSLNEENGWQGLHTCDGCCHAPWGCNIAMGMVGDGPS